MSPASRRAALISTVFAMALLALEPVHAQEAASTSTGPTNSRLVLRRPPAGTPLTPSLASWGWTAAGLTLALGAVGGAAIASRRAMPPGSRETGSFRVIARSSLGPKHSAYLVRAGDQVLLIGTGPAGPPALLGALPTNPADETAAGGVA